MQLSSNRAKQVRVTGLKFYTLIILFCPTFWGVLGSTYISLGQIGYTFIVLGSGLLILWFRKIQLLLPNKYLCSFCLLTLSFTFTVCYNTTQSNSLITITDFSDISRPVICLLSLSIGASLSSKNISIRFINFFLLSILLCSFFDVIKFFDFGKSILKIYTHLNSNSFNYIRFSGTFAYCYNYCFILLFGLLLSFSFPIKHKIPYIIIFIVLIALTGSRAGFIALIFAIIGIRWIDSGVKSAFKTILWIIVIGFTSLSLLIVLDIPLINEIISNTEKLITALSSDYSSDGSLSTRNSQLSHVFSNLRTSPFFGKGPEKNTSAPIEIQLGYYLSSWGFIGTFCFLSIIFITLLYSWKNISGRDILSQFSKANFIWILCSFIMGLSTPITDQIRVSQFFYLIQGIQFALSQSRKGNSYNIFYKN